jgi:hypothetical protein
LSSFDALITDPGVLNSGNKVMICSDYLEVGEDVVIKDCIDNSHCFETCEDVPVADFEKVEITLRYE